MTKYLQDEIGDEFAPVVFENSDPRIEQPYEGNVEMDSATKWIISQPNDPLEEPEAIALLEEVADYIGDVIERNGPVPTIRVATTLEAINGLNTLHFPHSNRINMQSSAGVPYVWDTTQGKKDFFDWDEKLQIFRPSSTIMGKRLTDDIANLVRNCKARRKTCAVFRAQLKDEVKKRKHIKKPKTRTFAAGPLHLNIAWRKYFMMAEGLIINLNGKRGSPFTNGMAPHSEEWSEMIRDMLSVGPNGFDEDTTDWDAKFLDIIMKNIWRVYDKLYQRFGAANYKEKDATIREGIYKHFFEPLISIGNKIIQMHGGPSGKNATRTDNDILQFVQKLRCWKAWVRQIKGGPTYSELLRVQLLEKPFTLRDIKPTVYSMMKYTCPKFGGDDHFNTISPLIEEYYHFNIVSEIYKSVMDFEITDAQKSREGFTVRPLFQLEFLKRVPIKINGQYYGQLVRSSIDKTLNWSACPAKRFPDEADSDDIICGEGYDSTSIDLLHESALHGRRFFDLMRKHLHECLENIDSTVVLPSWREVCSNFWNPLE
nr:MAG: nonstructural protein [Riboviria sp.]